VDDCDLNAEGFSPVLTEAERRGYHEEPANIEPVAPYVERLRAADALVMVFPVWNFGYPAILKGFLDRVFLPGVSFKLEDGKVKPNLTKIRKLAAVTTYGGTRMRALLVGDPPRKCVTRAVWHVCRPDKMKYLALYDMNRADDAKRAAFLTGSAGNGGVLSHACARRLLPPAPRQLHRGRARRGHGKARRARGGGAASRSLCRGIRPGV
jgi:NAD(P)H dehydrogenase (quinone)